MAFSKEPLATIFEIYDLPDDFQSPTNTNDINLESMSMVSWKRALIA